MNELIPEPVSGADILPWAMGVTDVCRRFAGVGSSGLLVREGPGGIGYDGLPENKRNKVVRQQDVGCFYIASKSVEAGEDPEEGQSTISIGFGNPYYRCAGKTFESSEDAISDVELPAIVALKIDITENLPDAELTGYSSLQELYADEKDKDYVIHPLYKFDASGKLVCDFRNILQSDMAEFANPE